MRTVVDRTSVDQLCDQAAALLAWRSGDLICDVRAIQCPDAATVDALARIHLMAKQSGREMRVRGASDQLRDLIAFMGLRNLLLVEAGR